MPLFKRVYRASSHRLREWDYGSNGYYFITICTKNRVCCLGTINAGRVGLSEMGNVVACEWQKTPLMRDYVTLDYWVVMPNHIHGILILNRGAVETQSSASLPYRNKFGPQSHNLSSVIRGFKAATTTFIRKEIAASFAWQSNYFDHIIRNQRSLDQIREYIMYNPAKWEWDKENPECRNIDDRCRDR